MDCRRTGFTRFSPFSLVAALFVSVVVGACDGGGAPGARPEAGVVILDAGQLPPPDGGEDAGSDGGETPPDAGGLYDGGPPEVGVRCGATFTPCAADVPCCVSIVAFAPEIATAGACALPGDAGVPMCMGGPIPAFSFGCDDAALDCSVGEECCFTGIFDQATFNIDVKSECRSANTCAGEGESLVCTTSADCPASQQCCGGGGLGITLAVDLGLCAESCDIALPDGGLPGPGGNDAGM